MFQLLDQFIISACCIVVLHTLSVPFFTERMRFCIVPWPLMSDWCATWWALTRSPMNPLVVHQPAYPSIWPAAPSLQQGMPTNPVVITWCVCGCSWRDRVCHVCGCYRGGIVVMDVIWRRLCVSLIWGRDIYLFWVGQGGDEWCGEVSLQIC